MSRYSAFYSGQRIQLTANDEHQARSLAVKHFRVPKSKVGLVVIMNHPIV